MLAEQFNFYPLQHLLYLKYFSLLNNQHIEKMFTNGTLGIINFILILL